MVLKRVESRKIGVKDTDFLRRGFIDVPSVGVEEL